MQAKGNTAFVCPPQPHPIHTDGKELAAEITELCSYIYAATYRLLVLIREFDEQGYWEWPGLCSCAHWLNFKCGIGIRYQVVVHVSAETLKADSDVSAETSSHINAGQSHVEDGPAVSAETSRRIACDCSRPVSTLIRAKRTPGSAHGCKISRSMSIPACRNGTPARGSTGTRRSGTCSVMHVRTALG